MFRNLLKNKKAQNTAEYALLIALVVAGIIAMQTYAQRALQARVKDASSFMTTNTTFPGITSTNQYEPYYQKTDYQVTSDTADSKHLGDGLVRMDSASQRVRTGNQQTTGVQQQ